MNNETIPVKESTVPHEDTSNSARCILVVEDEAEVSKVVSQILINLGYKTIQCNHAQEALEFMQAKSKEIDLILVDYRMPDMTGLDLIAVLRQENCNVPVIMMTGYAATVDRILAERMDRFTILKKPIGPNQLGQAITASLGTVVPT